MATLTREDVERIVKEAWEKGARPDLSRTDLINANLSGANLSGANLSGANLSKADLRGATVEEVIFGDIDLSEVKGLDKVEHRGPSYIDTHILRRSKGQIPEVFLRGCGLSDWEIENARLYRPNLTPEEY